MPDRRRGLRPRGAAQGGPCAAPADRDIDQAILGLEGAKIGRSDPDLALAERKALVAARWTLIDHFESDGKHYVLAQRNEAMMTGFEMLTAREKQVLGFAGLGHSNKLVAYELGIAAPTVAVLLSRAARKLRTHSRSELLETYGRLSSA